MVHVRFFFRRQRVLLLDPEVYEWSLHLAQARFKRIKRLEQQWSLQEDSTDGIGTCCEMIKNISLTRRKFEGTKNNTRYSR